MKVHPNMITIGSLVTHTGLGIKGIVVEEEADIRIVRRSDNGTRIVWNVRDLEWSDEDPTSRVAAFKKILTSLECTAAWLEGGCNPLHAAEELRLNIATVKKLRDES